jgi:hypothetical protein
MTSCEDKLSSIIALCDGDNTALCDQIRAINGNNQTDIDDLWGADDTTTFVWQMVGIGILCVWLCYWVAWFWMAGGLGTTSNVQKVGEKKGLFTQVPEA